MYNGVSGLTIDANTISVKLTGIQLIMQVVLSRLPTTDWRTLTF